MEIKEFYGDVLTSVADLIMHQVNCSGVFNSGVAKSVRDKYPNVYAKYKDAYDRGYAKLGNIQVVEGQDGFDSKKIVNLFAQEKYGYDKQKYTSYDALDTCMHKLRTYCEENYIHSIALPWHMSSDRGGADWNVVLAIIKSSFEDSNVTFEVWKL